MRYLNEFTFDSFDEAMNIHKKLFEIGRKNRYVTYADLILLIFDEDVHIPQIYYKYGWNNLIESRVEHISKFKWVLKLPQIKLLKKIKENE